MFPFAAFGEEGEVVGVIGDEVTDLTLGEVESRFGSDFQGRGLRKVGH